MFPGKALAVLRVASPFWAPAVMGPKNFSARSTSSSSRSMVGPQFVSMVRMGMSTTTWSVNNRATEALD